MLTSLGQAARQLVLEQQGATRAHGRAASATDFRPVRVFPVGRDAYRAARFVLSARRRLSGSPWGTAPQVAPPSAQQGRLKANRSAYNDGGFTPVRMDSGVGSIAFSATPRIM